jgi:hypothetical protein
MKSHTFIPFAYMSSFYLLRMNGGCMVNQYLMEGKDLIKRIKSVPTELYEMCPLGSIPTKNLQELFTFNFN